ncbi:hypothetical protein [Enterococcus diestrammenae]|uniref:hypothetical protein n=1 Tax=Enterococcus diestrammenae TaxID=1155073 RepID=UPI00195C06CE|nr:hypothetical protein [Enterococcus diestrammenae]
MIKKLIVCLFAVVGLGLVYGTGNVLACEGKTHDHGVVTSEVGNVLLESSIQQIVQENDSIDDEGELIISPRAVCVKCSGFAAIKCKGNMERYDTSTHNTLFSGKCTVTYYRSERQIVCTNCFYVQAQSGKHDCHETHSKCSKGNYNVCPL